MFVTHWYPELLGKYMLSDAFTATEGYTRKAWVPGCDEFGLMFNCCDLYNHRLHDRSWPHRCNTAEQQQYNFLLICVLTNTYHAYLDTNQLRPEQLFYKDFGESLADGLFIYACCLRPF
jgi:hypothetical protein